MESFPSQRCGHSWCERLEHQPINVEDFKRTIESIQMINKETDATL